MYSYEFIRGAIERWEEIQQKVDKKDVEYEGSGKKKRKVQKGAHKPFYLYSYNGSRFDSIELFRAMLMKGDEKPKDELVSNNKLISFTWKNFVARDACLITMSNLKSACDAFSLETKKTNLPHRYMQQCDTFQQVIDRLWGKVSWGDLEPYMDFFSETKEKELHKRYFDKSHKTWMKEQTLYKEWEKEKEDTFIFADKMEDYLDTDVQCLYEARVRWRGFRGSSGDPGWPALAPSYWTRRGRSGEAEGGVGERGAKRDFGGQRAK